MADATVRRPRAGARIAASAAAVALAASGLVGGAEAPAAERLVVKQGARMFVDNQHNDTLTACTIGFNDPEQRRSYTAGHCADNGDYGWQTGSLVYLADSKGREMSTPAGMIYPAAAYYGASNANDWAVIYWFNGVEVGANPYGGEYVPIQDLEPGETLCYHGYASHGGTTEASCGPFVGMIEKTIYFDAPGMPDYGDSGGPVYAPGRGLVGVMSGANALVDESGEEIVGFERASSLQSGALYDDSRIDTFLRSHLAATTTSPSPSRKTPAAPSPVRSTVVTPVAEVTREPSPAVTSVSGNTIHIAGPTKRSVVIPAATLQAPIPVGAATPSSVPSEAPVVTPEAPAEDEAQSSEDTAEETRDRSVANALLITLGIVAAVAALVPAIGYMMGLI
ncbi:hypothetical protein CAFEA_08375 [Corynebacterium afermentans subsp. afermentans]|uniref:Trypsin n=1 Tax=Corynebacterium afermentans TaxID=38286 RepID=A0A9X8R3W7_9CORY|nr:hypothetical protein [Corynebacterium afermentans]OAA16600.1 hypothetical protein Caferm_03505 [Corynebacterium afermentans subsp. afermentans]WJY57260.1 hypothetical protein CAFEA_08375 [Corynebacterium afermentans subsp. afermentans]SIQ27994.1 hypothetical protein SAMN05421802_11016 [Corynebacterium afermentans]